MAFDGSGNYVPAAAPNFPAISGNVISATYYNATINELCTSGLSLVLTRDGQGKPSAPINWNNQNLTGVAVFAATSASFTSALPVTSGGTGLLAVPTNGQILIGNGTNYTLASLTAGANITITPGAGSITIAAASASGVLTISGGTTGLTYTGTTAITTGGTLAVANGGTGVTSSTGSGSVVLSTSPTIATATLSNATLTTPSLSSATLTGSPIAPTPLTADSSTAVATTAFVKAQNYITSSALSPYAPLASPPLTGTPTTVGFEIGFRDVPQNSQTSAYQLVLTDRGKHIAITTGGITVPANGTVAFGIGSAVTIVNDSASTQTIAITTDTMTLAGSSTTGTRTIAINGIATLLKIAATRWLISGNVS